MRRHILQTQLIGEMRVDIAQRLLHFAIVRRGRPAGLRRVVLRRVIFDNHKVELFFQAILDDQLQQIRRSDNPRIVHLRHIAKRLDQRRIVLPAVIDVQDINQFNIIAQTHLPAQHETDQVAGNHQRDGKIG